jgi:hypothetical protein
VPLEATRQNDKVEINAYIAVRMQETHRVQERSSLQLSGVRRYLRLPKGKGGHSC